MSNITRTITLDDSIVITLDVKLSSQELYDAYCEQEHKFDKEDVVSELENLAQANDQDICGLPYDEITDEMIEAMADEKRRQMDKYGADWDYARDEAIGMVIKKELSQRGLMES